MQANHNNALTMLPADRGMLERLPERELQLGWFDWLVARRRLFYSLIAVAYLLCFNGLWRVGVDSALYRGLARSLANGEGYVFAGEHHRHAYPGLPVMLAGLERLFGDSPVPGLVVMTLMALATLWLIDRTIALRFPVWVATVVTIGVGFNFKLLRQSQQLMTDVPFLFGVMLALYALERLRLLAAETKWTAYARWALTMIVGLSVAAATRPTFAVLAGAIIAGSGFRLFRRSDRRRWLHATILSSALLVMLALFLFDPRTRGFSPFGGVYEQELLERLHELPRIIVGQLNALLGDDLNDIFFSQRLFPVSYLAAISLLIGAWFVTKRNVVWGLMIFGLIIVTLPLSTVPRYFLMVAPFLWLGWTLLWCRIAVRVKPEWVGPVLALALGFPLIVNIARCVDFIYEQRRPDVVALFSDKTREDSFYETYREGVVPGLRRMAAMIAANSTQQQTVIGPEAHVLAYYADRRVIGERTLFIDREAALSQWPKLVKEAKPDLVIFPYGAYGENDSLMRDLIRRRILVAELSVAKVDDVFLATCNVRPPPPGVNWRTYKAPPDSTTKSSGSTTKRSAVRKGSATQRAEQLAARERRLDREKKIRRAQKQAKIEKLEKQARRERIEKIEKRERAERRQRIERRERIERKQRQQRQQKKKAKRDSTSQPTTMPAGGSTSLPAMFPTTLEATFAVTLPATTPATR